MEMTWYLVKNAFYPHSAFWGKGTDNHNTHDDVSHRSSEGFNPRSAVHSLGQTRSQCLSSYHPLELERGWLSDPLVEYSVYIGELYNMMTRTDVEHAQAKGDWWRLRFQPCGLAFITIVIFVNLICESDKLDWFWTLFWSVFRIPEINKNWNSKGTRVET